MRGFARPNAMRNGKAFPIPVRVKYSCDKCPAYCCTYSDIEVSKYDIERLARHLGIDYKVAEERYTRFDRARGARMLRHHKDPVFDSACTFLDPKTRRCGVYEARPRVCRTYPEGPRCGYYDFLAFEREQQGDEDYVALT